MSTLSDAIAIEISQREEQQAALHEELEGIRGRLVSIDEQLEQLQSMREQAANLNGNGTTVPPKPTKPGRRAKANGDRDPSLPGRKGGNAPDSGRRATTRRSGSAPSNGSRTSSGGPGTQSEGGGTKRAAVLAYVHEHGRVKAAAVAEAVGISVEAVRQHLKALVDSSQIQAEGATSSRVYFTTSNGDHAAGTRRQAKSTGTTAPLPQLKRQVLDAIARDPGALTEDRIAQALHVDREDVAVATGELLDQGDVILAPDGTYTIDRGGVAEPVDLAERIMTALRASDSPSLLGSQLAVQVSTDGHGKVTTPDIHKACAELQAAGRVTRTDAFGGQYRWSVAK